MTDPSKCPHCNRPKPPSARRCARCAYWHWVTRDPHPRCQDCGTPVARARTKRCRACYIKHRRATATTPPKNTNPKPRPKPAERIADIEECKFLGIDPARTAADQGCTVRSLIKWLQNHDRADLADWCLPYVEPKRRAA